MKTSFPLRFGASLLAESQGPSEALELEARGFDLVLVADHLFHFREPEQPILDGWARLAAITQTTTRARIGTLVTNLAWRQPVQVAKSAIAIDQLSGGRLELGVGCGRYEDQAMAGILDMPPRERVDRLDEGTEILYRLLGGDTRPFAGKFSSYDEAHVAPGCVQTPRPPLVVAASGVRALGVAARWADTWNCATHGDIDNSLAILADRSRILDTTCERLGRDPRTLRRSLLVWPDGIDPWADHSVLAEIVERFGALGFSDFIMFPPRSENANSFDRVTATVLPSLRG